MTTYDLTSSIPAASALKNGDILNCPYSGTYKTVTLPPGKYKLECWGAQGGSGSGLGPGYGVVTGGKGGYSYGELSTTEDKTLYLYSGGKGEICHMASKTGGWNGGGGMFYYVMPNNSAWNSGTGGGASDICTVPSEMSDSYYRTIRSSSSYLSRIIVAGGGGSAGIGYRSTISGYGGGVTGGSGSGGGGTAQPGSQTSAGSDPAGYSYAPAGFGYGASGKIWTSNTYQTVGAGGGWYGGASTGDANGPYSAGGSGYVYTSSTASIYPSGCLLDSSYYLTNAATINGDTSFIDYSGSTVTGHSGNGACRISVLELAKIITTSASSGGTCTANKPVGFSDESVVFTFTPNSGYKLTAATVNGTSIMSSLSSSGGTYTHTVNGDINVVATYQRVYTLTTSASDGGMLTPASGEVLCDANTTTKDVTFTFTPNAGYYLANATINGESIVGSLATTGGTYTATISVDTTVVATYAKVFDILFNISGQGTIEPADSKVYCAIGSDTKTVTYTFAPGLKYDLTYAAIGDTDITSSLPKQGGTYNAIISANTTIAAVFRKYFDITSTAIGSGIVKVADTAYENTSVTAQIVPYSGFLISTVVVDDVDVTGQLNRIGESAEYTFTPTKDTHITATFLKTCRITTNSTAGGTLTASESTVIAGSEVTFTFTADTGYGIYLAEVAGNDITSQLPRGGGTYTMTVSEDVSAFVEWKKIIKVNIEDYSGGTVEVLEHGDLFTDHQTEIFLGSDVTFAFVPDKNHVLTNVTVINGTTEHILTKTDMIDLYDHIWYHTELNVTEDINVIAVFTKVFRVDTRCPSGGTISWAKSGDTIYDTDEGYESDTAKPTGIIVKDSNEKITVTVTPNAGYIVNSIALEYIDSTGISTKTETITASKETGVTEVINLDTNAQDLDKLYITAGFAYVPLKVKVGGVWKNAKLYNK